jgi:hypothetical protein
VTGVSDARPQRAYSETTCTKRYLAENVRLGPRGPEREILDTAADGAPWTWSNPAGAYWRPRVYTTPTTSP